MQGEAVSLKGYCFTPTTCHACSVTAKCQMLRGSLNIRNCECQTFSIASDPRKFEMLSDPRGVGLPSIRDLGIQKFSVAVC